MWEKIHQVNIKSNNNTKIAFGHVTLNKIDFKAKLITGDEGNYDKKKDYKNSAFSFS
jgi:hypothetical protein